MSNEDQKAIEYYKVLHGSVQNAHNLAWTITGIFVPIMFGSLTVLIVNSKNLEDYQFFAGAVVLLCIPMFWIRIIKFLDNYNKVRFHLLRRVETYLSSAPSDTQIPPFEYYKVMYDRDRRKEIVPQWIDYMRLIYSFAAIFGVLVIASLVCKLLM